MNKKKKIAIYGIATALLASITTAVVYYNLRSVCKNVVFDFKDWLE